MNDLAAGSGLANARRTAWRCLLMDASKAVASAELPGDDEPAGEPTVTVGPFAEGMEGAIRIAEALPAIAAGTYELRFLRVAGLHFAAVWLKSETSDADLVLPLPPAPFDLDTARAYPVAELSAILQQAAVRKQTHRYHP